MSFFRKAGSDSESSDESEEELLQSSDDESGSDAPKTTKAKITSTSASSKPKASKFLRGGSSDDSDSDSEESSDDDSDDDDEDDDDNEDGAAGAGAAAKKKTIGSKFLKSAKGAASDSSSDEDEEESDEETVKVVKSAKTKRMDEMEATEKSIQNAQRIGDWASVNSEYDKLARLAAPLPGSTSSLLPPVFLRTILFLEETLASTSTSAGGKKAKMNATAAKALTAVKQKVKKATRDNEGILTEYKEDKDAYAKKYEGGPIVPAASQRKSKSAGNNLQSGGAAADDEFMTVGKGGKALAFGSSSDGVFKNLQIILEARGKKNTDRADQLKALNRLYVEQCPTVYAKVRVLLALISSYFDYAAAGAGVSGFGVAGYMPLDIWAQARTQLNELLDILLANIDSYVVQEVVKEEYDDLEERAPNQNGEGPVVHIRGNVVSLVERLDDEFFKSLQNLDPHASEYVDRLRDEKLVYDTLVRGIKLFELYPENGGKSPDGETALGRVLLRRLDHIYSKPDIVVASLESSLPENLTTKLSPEKATAATAPALTRAICIYLYKHSAGRVRTRALLFHIYHAALHDDYYNARNMFNMSNVQADVPYADVETQGLFNRTLVQVGLCAFRVGLIEEAEQTLREITQTQRVKELLFQGIPTFTSRHSNLHLTPEQEKLERSRQLPFHMHINLDLLECVYLTSSMLIEVPQLAKEEASPELRKQVSSRVFRRMLDISERQAFTGPPENKRDHVIQASKALMGGDWQRCTELITTIKVWNLMTSEGKIKEMLGRKIQEVALRTYLFTSAKFYSNISLDHLATTLSLPVTTVTPVVSRMIWEEEISGSLDQSSSMLSLQRVERTALQQQSMDLLERAENMVRLLGHTRPGYGDDSKEGQSGTADGQQGRRGGERRRGTGGYRGGRGRGAAQFAGPIRAM